MTFRPSRRQVVAGGLLLPLTSAVRALSTADGVSPSARDYLARVDPGLRSVASSRMAEGTPSLDASTLAAWRSRLGAAAPAGTGAPDVATVSVPVPGAPDVVVHVVGAAAGGRRPAVLHLHGGGFVMGSAAASLPSLRRLSADLDCVVATVDYRLAPETTWSGSTTDAYAALAWLHRSASALGVDRDRIAVMGESAGGGQAALLALAARDRGEFQLVFQALLYPMLDDRTGSTVAAPSTTGRLVWTSEQNRFGWSSFLGRPAGGPGSPASAVPARRTDLAGLPPAFVGVGTLDLFVDEDVDYARRLVDAGVPAELLVLPGAFHAFDLLAPDAAVSRRFTSAWRDALRRAFAVPAPPRGVSAAEG